MSERVMRFLELSDPPLTIAAVLQCYAERSTNSRDSIGIGNCFECIDSRLKELLRARIILISEKHEEAIAGVCDRQSDAIIESRRVPSHTLAVPRRALDVSHP